MSIKVRIIVLSLIGNLAIGAIFFALYGYQDKQKEASESSATIYGQAWRTVLNDSIPPRLFHPQSETLQNRQSGQTGSRLMTKLSICVARSTNTVKAILQILTSFSRKLSSGAS